MRIPNLHIHPEGNRLYMPLEDMNWKGQGSKKHQNLPADRASVLNF